MTTATTDLIGALRDARIFDLSQPLERGIPTPPSVPPFALAWLTRHGDGVIPGGTSFAQELVSMGTHTGTHLDALNHVSCNGRLYGDRSAAESAQHEELAIAAAPFVHHGVCLDIATLRGAERLAPGEAVTAHDLERARASQGLDIPRGAAVLVRTGWGDREHYRSVGYVTNPPGVVASGAELLREWGVALTGADTFMYEQPPEWPGPLPVHAELIGGAGVHIAENLFLEELARERVGEFALIVAPLSMTGASGSPIRPLALVS